MEGHTTFKPDNDIPNLGGKIILVTGGTAGLGAASIRALVKHSPEHVYFTGRNISAANALISEITNDQPDAHLTFIQMDLSSLQSVKESVKKSFKHDRLDILMNNAGIIVKPAILSTDGYEIQFATNYLGHAMLTRQLLPFLLTAAKDSNSDVRIINSTSDAYGFHRAIKGGISFAELDAGGTMSRTMLGGWIRYGHSKLANILFAAECARRYPNITSVSIHPGLVDTPMNTDMDKWNKAFVNVTARMSGVKMISMHEGVLNQLWCAVGAKKRELRNGSFYRPVGVDCWDKLSKEGQSDELAKKLWDWTDGVLAKVD